MIDVDVLQHHARMAMEHAYAPYSHFRVGACVMSSDGKIFHGANVENASYGLCCCAERNALFAAVSNGVKKGEFVALALVSENDEPISPCGACRQVMMELMPRDALVIMAGRKRQKTATVADLLPMAFDEEDIR